MTMEETIRRLGDAELEIMQAVWAAGESVSSTYVQQALRGRRDWALGALMTALGRLCDKGFLRREKQGRNNLYAPLIDERTYQQREGRTILERLYGNSVTGLVAALYDGHSISDRDLAELRRFLEEKEAPHE